jgi:uncharacterized alkaline shock family protein YloU
VHQPPGPNLSSEVLTSTVWDAIRSIEGVADLHRSPLQSFGERVHMERHGPVFLAAGEAGLRLEIHIVALPDANLCAVGEAVAQAGATYLARTTGTPAPHVEVHIDDVLLGDEE